MTLGEAYRLGIDTLSRYNIDDSHIEARLLLCHLLNLSPTLMYARSDLLLSNDTIENYQYILQKRLNHEPSAYITGNKEFYGIEFHVDINVLIPRPETELLVSETLKIVDLLNKSNNQPVSVADIGTGSGAIAISLALHRPELKIFAVDSSAQALQIACYNARRHYVENRITFLCGNLLTPLPEPVDIIVANLPYISDNEFKALDPEIRDYEPMLALRGGKEGLDIIAELVQQVGNLKSLPYYVLLEIAHTHSSGVKNLLVPSLPDATCNFIKDGSGIERIARIILSHDDSILQI